ncbi:MAG: thiamine phosphate synthase [Candidatus Omnitrophota bacterium]|nr:thiamine phosphate synthase [Candidatus Omnitrophota bacterium]
MQKIDDYSLYLVISEEYGLGKSALEIARLAILGGVDIIQMREKSKTGNELAKLACELSMLCKEKGVAFIVNDDPLIAKESDASGVHLGQEDMQKYTVTGARKIIGKGKIIGISTHSVAEIERANKDDVDYIAFGPIFPTKAKNYFIGIKDIKEALKVAKKPLVFIGGINLSNLDEILKEGGKNIALIRDIIQAEDIAGMAGNFKKRLEKEKG